MESCPLCFLAPLLPVSPPGERECVFQTLRVLLFGHARERPSVVHERYLL